MRRELAGIRERASELEAVLSAADQSVAECRATVRAAAARLAKY